MTDPLHSFRATVCAAMLYRVVLFSYFVSFRFVLFHFISLHRVASHCKLGVPVMVKVLICDAFLFLFSVSFSGGVSWSFGNHWTGLN